MKHPTKHTKILTKLFISLCIIAAFGLLMFGLRARVNSQSRPSNVERNGGCKFPVRAERRQSGAADDSLMRAVRAVMLERAATSSQLFQARLLPDNGNGGSKFGWSVSVSGNTALVGAYLQHSGTARTGVAYIFQRTGANWSLQATLMPEGEPLVTNFGISVALSGDIAVVSRTGNQFLPSGAVYIYQRNGTAWSRQEKIEPGSRLFGSSLALSGDTLLVGDYLASTTSAYQSGAAYAYRFNGSAWQLEAQLLGSALQAFDSFGISVAISGDTAVVGAYSDDTNGGLDAGSAYIFQRSGTIWSEQAYLVPNDTAAGDYYGWSVDVSGDTAVVGAYLDDFSGISNAGSVTVYQRSGATWTRQTKLVAAESQSGGYFGYSVSLKGDTVVVGAQLFDVPPVQNTGAAYVFQRFNNIWFENGPVTLDTPALNDAFGTSVSLSDNTFIVGIPNSDINPVPNLGSSQIYLVRPAHRHLGDFDGDTFTDLSVFRPSDNTWYARQSSNGAIVARQFATGGDKPAPGDYDGDGKTDIAVFRPSNATWYTLFSSNNVVGAKQFGLGSDIPVPADYDGDGLTDIAVFRPSEGVWYINLVLGNTIRTQTFGTNGDRPVPGDYDGDSKADLAVFRPLDNNWYIYQSLTNSVRAQQWGNAGDVAVPGDYDGDTKRDLAVFRPSDGGWYILTSTLNLFRGQAWGTAGDIPAPGDYNADGRTDFAVFRQGTWYILQSGSNALRAEQWGTAGDMPVPASLNQ